MPRDDMFVVMYKILSYLYSCEKKGEKPLPSLLTGEGDLLHINEAYFANIIEEMVDEGLVKGFQILKTWSGTKDVVTNDPRITIKGVEFLQENSMMKKVAKALKDAKDILPFI